MVSKEKVLVQFENVHERYFIDDKPVKVEYVLNTEYEPSTKDWLGIFPKGWRELEQQLLGEHAVTRSSKDNKRKKVIEFNLSYLLNGKMNFFNADYQIVYVSKNRQVIGRSSYFRLQRKYGDMLSRGDNAAVYEGNGAAHITANPMPTVVSSKVEIPSPPPKSIVRTVNCSSGVGFPLVKPYRSESILPYYARDFGSHCRYCSNVMEQNHSLLDQVKELAHLNRQMSQSLANLEQKFELSMVAQKRLKLWCICLRQEKHAYEVFVGELLKCLQGNSPVCVRDSAKGSELLVQRVNPDLNNHALSHPMRHTSSVSDRYLKAIIGSQEAKIQELSAKLCDLGKKLAQFEMNSSRRNCDCNALESKSNKHSDFEEYENDKNILINNSNGGCNSSGIENKDEPVEKSNNEIVKKNGLNSYNKSTQEVEAIIEVCRVSEKLEAVICDVNNNCDFSDNDDDGEIHEDGGTKENDDRTDYDEITVNYENSDCSFNENL